MSLPASFVRDRENLCRGCNCGVEKSDPCARCPKFKWPPIFCNESVEFIPPAIVEGLPASSPKGEGAGTKLKALLGRIGIRPVGPCRCNARAALMDRKGPDWCEENIDTIVEWLREEATARRLPFVAPAARLVVRLAIRKARSGGRPAGQSGVDTPFTE